MRVQELIHYLLIDCSGSDHLAVFVILTFFLCEVTDRGVVEDVSRASVEIEELRIQASVGVWGYETQRSQNR